MEQIPENRTIGELVAERPSHSNMFDRLGIDYCGGKITLESMDKREA